MRIILILTSLLVGSHVLAQPTMPATTRADLDALSRLAHSTSDARKLTVLTEGRYPTALIHGRCMVGFLGHASPGFTPASDGPVQWGARIGDVVSFRIDAYHLQVVHDLPGMELVELAGKVAPSLQKVLRATRADSVHRGINLPQAFTGKDVLIGITDWGFDYTHPMFYDTTLTTTRIRAAWDQFRQAGPPPPGFNYGTELATAADLLTMQSDTANIYSWATHGTHVAGIAGGSGAGTVHRGIAFEAQFLFNTFLVDAAAVLDAFAWMQQIAQQDGKRLVVNMSWGLHHMGTLDGTSLLSQAIDQLSAEGVVFVTSGGNNGNENFHIRKEFTGDMLRSRIQFYPYSAHPKMWGQSISMWGEPGAAFSAGFSVTSNSNIVLQESPLYHTATQPDYLDSMLVEGNDTVFFNLTADAAHPLNGRPHFRLRIKNTSGQLRIVLKATAPSGTVHFWNVTELTNDVGNWGQAFLAGQSGWTAGDALYGIGEPACSAGTISVAAYSSETYNSNGSVSGGGIASFSSTGPTLDGRIKPDIAAPGVSVASSISAFTDDSYTTLLTVDFQGTSYPFARFSGTSMSGPAVAGVAALVLEADPQLSPAGLKVLLQQTARTDNSTGVIPSGGSPRWGAGKVNAYRAIVQQLGLTGIQEQDPSMFLAWPNPATDVLNVMTFGSGPAQITVTDVTGRLIYMEGLPNVPLFTMNTRSWPKGVYLLRLDQGGRTAVTRVVKQ